MPRKKGGFCEHCHDFYEGARCRRKKCVAIAMRAAWAAAKGEFASPCLPACVHRLHALLGVRAVVERAGAVDRRWHAACLHAVFTVAEAEERLDPTPPHDHPDPLTFRRETLRRQPTGLVAVLARCAARRERARAARERARRELLKIGDAADDDDAPGAAEAPLHSSLPEDLALAAARATTARVELAALRCVVPCVVHGPDLPRDAGAEFVRAGAIPLLAALARDGGGGGGGGGGADDAERLFLVLRLLHALASSVGAAPLATPAAEVASSPARARQRAQDSSPARPRRRGRVADHSKAEQQLKLSLPALAAAASELADEAIAARPLVVRAARRKKPAGRRSLAEGKTKRTGGVLLPTIAPRRHPP